MILKKVVAYFLFFCSFLNVKFVLGETLESIEMENKSLQIEIDSVKAKIANLENNPEDDPDCENIKSELKIAEAESKESENVYTTGSETIKSLNKQISSLEDKERSLDTQIKKHKTAQTTTGVLGGVFGLAAGGIGLWSHLEKNKIERGEYTNPKCVSNIFDGTRGEILSKLELEIKSKSSTPKTINQSDFPKTLDLLAEAGSDCLSCCPGKADECEKSSNSIKDELEQKLAGFIKNPPPVENDKWRESCKNIMNYYDNLKAVYDAVNKDYNFNSDEKGKCFDYLRSDYGRVAVAKVNAKYNEGTNKNKYRSEYLQTQCIDEFCSKGLFNDNYPDMCVQECNKTNFVSYISDDELCKDALNNNVVTNLSDTCRFILNMNKSSDEKDRCFKYIVNKGVKIDFDKVTGLMNPDKLNNCLNMCECSYYGSSTKDVFGIMDSCKKQCNDKYQILPLPSPPLTRAPKLEEVKAEPKPEVEVVETQKPEPSKPEKYCENIEAELKSTCMINPYKFENTFGSSVSALLASRKNSLQNSGDACKSFKTTLQNDVKNYVCNCYLGFPVSGNTSKAIHFDCIDINNNAKSFTSNWKSNKTEMKLFGSKITEKSCIELYNNNKNGPRTVPSICN